jgi:GntR family transcriptional regulator
VHPDQRISGLLDVAEGGSVWRLDRVRRDSSGNPLMFLRNWVSKERCPTLDRDTLEERSLFRVLEEDYALDLILGRRTITAVLASDELADVLEVDAGSPLLKVEQITYTAGDQPLEYSDVWMPPSRMSMSSIVRRH